MGALRHLDIDVLTGKFGANTKDTKQLATMMPVTAMTYDLFDKSFLIDGVRNEMALIGRLLPQAELG